MFTSSIRSMPASTAAGAATVPFATEEGADGISGEISSEGRSVSAAWCRDFKSAVLGPRSAPVMVVAIALGGCSIPLGSLTPSAEPREEPAQSIATANIASLNRGIRNNPDDPTSHNLRGLALTQAGRTDEALADFNK